MGYLLDYQNKTGSGTSSPGGTTNPGSKGSGGYYFQYLQTQQNKPVEITPTPSATIPKSGIPLDVNNPYAAVTQVETKLSAGKPQEKNIFQKIGDFINNIFGIRENDYTRDNEVVRDINAGAVVKNAYPQLLQKKIDEMAQYYKTTPEQARGVLEAKAQAEGKSIYDMAGLNVNDLAQKSVGNPFRETLMEEITKELGVRNMPTNKEIADTVMTMAMGLGLATAPIPVLTGLGIFEGVSRIESGLISAVKGKGFDLSSGYTLGDFAGEHKNLQMLLDAVDFIAKIGITGGLEHKIHTELKTVAAKDFIAKNNFSKVVELDPVKFGEKVKESGHITKMLEDMGIKPEDYLKAVEDKGTIEIKSEDLVKAAREPYWKAMKEAMSDQSGNAAVKLPVEEAKTEVKPDVQPEGKTEAVKTETKPTADTVMPAAEAMTKVPTVEEKTAAVKEKLYSFFEKDLPTDEKAYQNTVKNGGVTISLEGESPSKGIAFSPYKDTEMKVTKDQFSPELVKFYMDKYKDRLEEPGNHLGLWESDGMVYFDISKVGDYTPETLAKAQEASQLAAFDLESFKEIPLGKIENGVYNKTYEASNHPYLNERKVAGAGSSGTTSEPVKVPSEGTEKAGATGTEKVTAEEKPSSNDKIPGSELTSSQKPVGEGEKTPSKAYSRIVERLTEETKQDVSYNRVNLEDQAKRATEFVNKEPEKALRVAFGLEPPPEGMLDRAVNLALAEKARMDGNMLLYSQLEASGSLRQTRRGQEIVFDRGRFNDNSPHRFISELLDARMRNFGKTLKSEVVDQFNKFSEAKKKAIEKIDSKARELGKILKARDKGKINMAQSILDGLTCK